MSRAARRAGRLRFLSAVFLIYAASAMWAGPAMAAPQFDRGEMLTDGTVIFPDTTEFGVYYYVPTRIQLRRDASSGKPEFFLYKYIAVKSAESKTDPKKTTKGGRLSLTLEMPNPTEDMLSRWKQVKGAYSIFRTFAPEKMTLKLIYTEVAQTAPESRSVAERDAPFTSQSLAVATSAETATLLWNTLEHKGNIAISADVTLTTKGFELVDKPDGKKGEKEYKEMSRTDRFSMPVDISREQYPNLFGVINLAQKVGFKYRSLRVLCFDFANETAPGLAQVNVDVEITSGRGQTERKTAVFTPRGDSEQTLEFKVPEKRGGTYRYRVTRISGSGDATVEDWTPGDDAFLDVTRYEIESGGEKVGGG
ncbi:MAG: hypothetical protein ACREJQ_07415 [bacterium]